MVCATARGHDHVQQKRWREASRRDAFFERRQQVLHALEQRNELLASAPAALTPRLAATRASVARLERIHGRQTEALRRAREQREQRAGRGGTAGAAIEVSATPRAHERLQWGHGGALPETHSDRKEDALVDAAAERLRTPALPPYDPACGQTLRDLLKERRRLTHQLRRERDAAEEQLLTAEIDRLAPPPDSARKVRLALSLDRCTVQLEQRRVWPHGGSTPRTPRDSPRQSPRQTHGRRGVGMSVRV